MDVNHMALAQRVSCVDDKCSENGVCCGFDQSQFFCRYHCVCFNRTHDPCPCAPGFGPPQCLNQEAAATWIAIILTVGAMLVLFIAWGFRCNDDGTDQPTSVPTPTAPAPIRDPLLREDVNAVISAASPPSRPPTGTSVSQASADGAHTMLSDGDDGSIVRRKCCICLISRISVVVIPCGHACMCRRCSFQVSTCPICRIPIQAQQRFYM